MSQTNNETSTIRKLKYGSLSVVFTAAFIALILALNLILSSIAPKVNLAVDISKEELYSLSDSTKQILDGLKETTNFKITITFLADRDKYESDQYTLMVRNLGEEFARNYPDNITVEYKDIQKDPAFAQQIINETQTTGLSSNYVVIKGAYHYRVLSLDAFFITSSETGNLYAFDGEKRFTAAIQQCSLEKPLVVAFTKGHGEPDISDIIAGKVESESASRMKRLCEILMTAGYEIQQVDLSRENLDERTEILIINNPKTDFIGIEDPNSENEIDKIIEFMTGYKDIIVFVNADTPELPNLQEYLSETWGINYKPYHKLSDMSHSIKSDGFSIVGQYNNSTSGTASYNITSVLTSYPDIKTVFRNAVELETVNANKTDYILETVMKTHSTAQSVYKDEAPVSGEFPLMLLSTYSTYVDNAKKYKYVLLSSSTDFATDEFMTSAFGNSKIVLGAMRIMSTERIVPDIDEKPFTETAMKIEAGTANTLAWLVSAVFPVIIICAGVAVFIKRRHL